MIDCDTRWNSTYDMIDHALQRNGPLKHAVFNSSDSSLTSIWLSPQDWNILKKLKETLSPLKEVTNVVSKQGFSIAEVLPVYEYAIFKLEKSREELSEDSNYNTLHDGIVLALDKLTHYFSVLSPITGASLLLNPEFKMSSLNDVSKWKRDWNRDCLDELKKVTSFS